MQGIRKKERSRGGKSAATRKLPYNERGSRGKPVKRPWSLGKSRIDGMSGAADAVGRSYFAGPRGARGDLK
jgi:hypothetical protein